jgi:hypothetical protein
MYGDFARHVVSLLDGVKQFPKSFLALSKRQFDVVLDNILKTDGTDTYNAIVWTTTSKNNVDIVQHLCAIHGYNMSVTIRDGVSGFENGKRQFHARIRKDISMRSEKMTITKTHGVNTMYCLTMPRGTMITRINGKVAFSGNTSILKRQEIDIIRNLCERINVNSIGKYSGFIQLMFNEGTSDSHVITMYYNHGSGGNSPVTRGVIKSNRRQSFIQADIIVSGHIHNEWVLSLPMVKVNKHGMIEKTEQTHISLGTYKDDSFTGGWADGNEFPPPNKGGAWIRFYWDNGIRYDVIRAQ